MKIEIKELLNDKWVHIEYDTMVDTSIISWIAENFNRTVLVAYHENGKPNYVICNDDIDIDNYLKLSAVLDENDNVIYYRFGVIRAKEQLELLGKTLVPKVVIEELPGGKIVNARTL